MSRSKDKNYVYIESKRVRKRLIDLNMTQRELAEKVGMNERFLTDVLAGRRPGIKYADKIYEVLGLKRFDQ